jgi:hypothetical protein
MMKRFLMVPVAVALLTCIAASGYSLDREEVDAVVEVEETVKSLARAAERGELPDGDNRAYLLDGIVAGIEVLESSEEAFRARIELVRGEWQGLEEVVLYKVYVDVSGAEFAARIPTGRSNEGPEDAILTDEPALVVGPLTDVTSDAEGTPIPVVDAFYIRNLP